MINDTSAYKNLYLETARNYLNNLKTNLSKLSENNQDIDAIDKVYLDAHSLKSESTAMNYSSTASLCHLIESIFREIKEKKAFISSDLLISLNDSLQNIASSLDNIDRDNKEIDLSTNLEKLKKLSNIEI